MSIWNGKYVSINSIITDVYRDMGMAEQINYTDAIEWVGRTMELIGSPFVLSEKVDILEVIEYRVKVPTCLHLVQTCWGYSGTIDSDCIKDTEGFTPMRYSTNAMHHYMSSCKDASCESQLTYKINDNYIFTNFEEGAIKLSYFAIPIDDKGFPLIPDQIKFREAIIAALKQKLGFIKWSTGKMPNMVYQELKQERDWYIGAAQTAGQMPSVDMMESIKNNWLRLIPKINQHADGFASAGNPEQRTLHNSTEGGPTNSSDKDSRTFFYYKDEGNSVEAGEE